MSTNLAKKTRSDPFENRHKIADKLIHLMNNSGVQYVDFRFSDSNGTWHHLTYHYNSVEANMLAEGITFDGSSIKGWRTIDDSDMLIMPDIEGAIADQLSEQPTLIVYCDIYDPHTNTPYTRDPRSIARKAEDYLTSTGIADTAYFGPEPEFFVFDEVHFDSNKLGAYYALNGIEGPYPTSPVYRENDIRLRNAGHRPSSGEGYFPVPPVDSCHELRTEMCNLLNIMGIEVEKHHHEVAPCQHEIGFKFSTLRSTADNLQMFKYVVRNVAHQAGKTATFMPKPVFGENGSGMHVHQSLWKEGHSIFAGDKYAGLSQEALYYIGGILKHANALNAFTNPTTNSYKRLVPGYEAPVFKAYSARNRSVAIRIPHTHSGSARRIETRFPDPVANPYLALAAMLMAGLDGIKNKIDPGAAVDKNLFDVKNDLGSSATLCSNLSDALRALDGDRAFLTEGEVFTNDQIDAYIDLKQQEINRVNEAPHPHEFELYYSA
jgi:glutamine synthetase